jgi:hypothetical protein
MRPGRFTLPERIDTLGLQFADLERMVSEKNPIRVFVAHLFEESDDYLRVFEFLESVERFFYLNVARPENFPEQGGPDAVKEELIQQIKQSEAVIVVADAFSREPDLVSFMMDVAEANDIGLIAVKPFGGIAETDREVVERVQEHVEWNDRELVDAIRRQARGEDTARWEVVDFPGWNADGEVKD